MKSRRKRSRFFQKANRLGGPQWFGDDEGAVFVDGSPDRVFGHYWHDGYGKWEMSINVSYWRAWRLIPGPQASFEGWARFPRCSVGIFRAKDVEVARCAVEQLSGFYRFERIEPVE